MSSPVAAYSYGNVTTLADSGLSTTEANFVVSSMHDVIVVMEAHAPYAMLIDKSVTPVWYVVGLLGNVLSALFWSSQRIRTCNTAAVYLTALALADFGYLALHIFYELENPWLVHTLNATAWCQVWNWFYMAAQYFCVFLVCAFTCERFLSICHPFKSERFGRTRSPRIILVLLLVSILMGSPQAYFWTVGGQGDVNCQVRHSQLMGDSFYSIWSWCTDMLIFGALPVLVLVLNCCVLRKIRSAGRLRLTDPPDSRSLSRYSRMSIGLKRGLSRPAPGANYGAGGQSADVGGSTRSGSVAAGSNGTTTACASGGSHNFTATTVTLLWVSFYLIFTTLPVTIVFAIQTAIPLGDPMPLSSMASDPVWRQYIAYYTTRVVIREIGMSHHVGNVFIYLATSRRFRRQLRKRLMNGGGSPCTPVDQTETTSLHSAHPMKTMKATTCG